MIKFDKSFCLCDNSQRGNGSTRGGHAAAVHEEGPDNQVAAGPDLGLCAHGLPISKHPQGGGAGQVLQPPARGGAAAQL